MPSLKRTRCLFIVGLLLAVPALAQVDATLGVNDARLQGTHPGGSLLLYSPDPVRSGSSLSHWDTSATPNLLMEPFATGDLPFLGLDITTDQMADVLWPAGTHNVNIFNADPPGVGFTDATPFGGAPGNPATTLGEARINLFNAVLGTWANSLGSSVDVDVIVTWQDLFCDPSAGATLAAAGTTFIFGLEGGGLPGPTFFHSALAESLVGTDLSGPVLDADGNIAGGDLVVFMNSAIDNECLAPGATWYYGLDGAVPAGLFDTAGVVLHELGHGLGFSNFTNETTGEQSGGLPGIYDVFTFDNTQGKYWDQMTNEERVASAINVGQVTWEGSNANAAAAAVLEPGVPELTINAPANIAGAYNIAPAGFGGSVPAGALNGGVACMKDAVAGATYLNGCSAATIEEGAGLPPRWPTPKRREPAPQSWSITPATESSAWAAQIPPSRFLPSWWGGETAIRYARKHAVRARPSLVAIASKSAPSGLLPTTEVPAMR